MSILENGDTTYIVAGATSGIGKAMGSVIEGDYYPIGGRNIETLAEVASDANKRGFFIPGNLFEEGTSAYNFFIYELVKLENRSVVQLFSSIDMDAIPIEEDGVIVEDYFDPRNGKKWDSSISKKEREEIRVLMADSQILFWEKLLESLLERESSKPLTIIYANSIISKFYENHSFRGHSQYGRLKNSITQLISEYSEKLKEKNVFIKNILLGLIDTPMFNDRGVLSAERTKKIVEAVAPNIPLGGEEIEAKELLSPVEVAEFLYMIGNIYPEAIPININLFHKKHLNLEKLMKNFRDKKNSMNRLINKNIIEAEKGIIELNKNSITFLIELRKESLMDYYTENKENKRVKESRLKNNIVVGEKIVSRLPYRLSRDKFFETCLRLEGNYP